MQKLDDIIWAWGCWRARQFGTTPHFTQATRYDQATELDDYHDKQCTASFQSIFYDQSSPPTTQRVMPGGTKWRDGAIDGMIGVNLDWLPGQGYHWDLHDPLNIGVEVTATVGVPDSLIIQDFGVMGIASETQGGQVSVRYQGHGTAGDPIRMSFPLTQVAHHEIFQPQGFGLYFAMHLPAQHSVQIDPVGIQQNWGMNWRANVLVRGMVAVWFDDWVALHGDGDSHHLWFVPVGSVLDDVVTHNLYDTTGYMASGDDILAMPSGDFGGSQGVNGDVIVTVGPLRADWEQHIYDQ